jgi:ubiquinone/menaquinone biosynthesis C-methylase UbiE
MGLYSFYERRIFPHLIERSMRRLGRYREATLAKAAGDVLEIGFGTGLNLSYYPASVRSLTAIDPLAALEERVQARIEAVPFPVERHVLAADGGLPFEGERFDCATITWTLCTISEPLAALREMRRVLRPGSPMLFIEHGRSDRPRVARWQDRLNPLQNFVGCGCNLNRRIDALIEEAGFRIDELDRFVADGTPEFLGHLYRGAASA